MNRIEGISAKKCIEFGGIFAFAFLAGSNRLIQYFPKTSREGLLLAVAFSSAASYTYEKTLYEPNDHIQQTGIKKTIAIALGAIGASFVAKVLKDQVSLSTNAAMKCALVHIALSSATLFFDQQLPPQESPLKSQHSFYKTHEKDWRRLGLQERTELIKKFYDAGLPAITLSGLPIQIDHFDNLEDLVTNLEQYTTSQLSWYREILRPNSSESPERVEMLFLFIERCQLLNIPLVQWNMDQSVVDIIRERPRYIDILYQGFMEDPLRQFYCQGQVDTLFMGREPLPSFEQVVAQLDVQKVEAMDFEHLLMWFWNNHARDVFEFSQEPVRIAFIKRFVENADDFPESQSIYFSTKPGDLTWLNELTDEAIANLTPGQVRWCFELIGNALYGANRQEITDQTLDSFNRHCRFEFTRSLSDYAEIAGELLPRDIERMEREKLKIWHFIYSTNEWRGWSSLDDSVKAAFVKCFIRDIENLYDWRQMDFCRTPGDLSWLNDVSEGEIQAFSNKAQWWFYTLLQHDKNYFPRKEIPFGFLRHYNTSLNTQYRYRLTPEALIAAKEDLEVASTLLNQFVSDGYDSGKYGFYELSVEDQHWLRELIGDERFAYFPYKLSHELIVALQENDAVKEDVENELHESSDENIFTSVSFWDMEILRKQFGNLVPPLSLTSEIVDEAKKDHNIVDELKKRSDEIQNSFQKLPIDDQRTLVRLFGKQYYLLKPNRDVMEGALHQPQQYQIKPSVQPTFLANLKVGDFPPVT